MITLRGALREEEEKYRLLDAALHCYGQSVEKVERTMLPLFPSLGEKHAPILRQIRRKIQAHSHAEDLVASLRMLESCTSDFTRLAQAEQAQEMANLRDILQVLARAADGMQARSGGYGQQLEQVSVSLDALAKADDLDAIRKGLREHSQHLRTCTEKMLREAAEAVESIQAESRQLQGRIEEMERLAYTDSLTNLANRRAVERELAALCQNNTNFSVISFDLDGFKAINDRFGHAAGDDVLRTFGNILREEVRSGDVVARLGGDEFLTILRCNLPDAMRRSTQIANRLSVRYPIEVNGRKMMLPIVASAGVVERHSGESAETLLHRVDENMYATKRARKRAAGEEPASTAS